VHGDNPHTGLLCRIFINAKIHYTNFVYVKIGASPLFSGEFHICNNWANLMSNSYESEARTRKTPQGNGKQDGEPIGESGCLGESGGEGVSVGLRFSLGAGGCDRGGENRTVSGGKVGGIVSQLIDDLLVERSRRLAEVEQLNNRVRELQQLKVLLEQEK
jgi:hypothetical protein